MGTYRHPCFQGRNFCLRCAKIWYRHRRADLWPRSGLFWLPGLEYSAVIGAATTVTEGRITENLVRLCLQGEMNIWSSGYLIQSSTNNGVGARRLLRSGPQKPSLCLPCPLEEMQWPPASLTQLRYNLLLIMLFSEQTVFAEDFRPVL